MDNSETVKQVYLLAQEHCGLKVGDWVRVTRKAEHKEGGWGGIWYGYAMNDTINKIGKVCGNPTSWLGIEVIFPDSLSCSYPYFVLEKVEKPAHKFKPFDKVLVRDNDHCRWTIDFYSYYIKGCQFPYKTLAGGYCQCIPYDGNEHLVGTTNKPEE